MAVVAAMEANRAPSACIFLRPFFFGRGGSLSACCLQQQRVYGFTVVASCCPWSIAGLVLCVTVKRAPGAGVCCSVLAVKSGLGE